MANKMYNKTLETVLMKCEHHKSLDFFIAITSLARQVFIKPDTKYDQNGKKRKTKYIFVVPCANNTVHCLWSELNHAFPNLINKTTIYKCVEEFIELGILQYNPQYGGFQIVDMEKMLQKKDKGFTTLRSFYFTDTFIKMPFAEKRVIMYITTLADKTNVAKKFKNDNGSDIVINLTNDNNTTNKDDINWINLCRTNDIYYVRKVINSILTNYPDIIEDVTMELRKKKYGKTKGIAPKGIHVLSVFFFNIHDNIKNKEYIEEDQCLLFEKQFPELKEKIETNFAKQGWTAGVSTKIALFRRLNKLIPFLQELVINKLIDRLALFYANQELPIRNINGFIQHIINTNRTIAKVYGNI